MTQIISVFTKDYVLLAADRRLTIAEGPRQGEVFDDDSCKLISLCNTCGIAYSGLARIEGKPTHEWLAIKLAEAKSDNPGSVAKVLIDQCTSSFSKMKAHYRPLMMLMTGWAFLEGFPGLRSHVCLITNMKDGNGSDLATPADAFSMFALTLAEGVELGICSIGQPVLAQRAHQLERNLRRLVERKIGPKEALRLLVEEIIHTSTYEPTVGSKILGFCIPKRSVEAQAETGWSLALAQQPNEHSAAFTYFDPSHSELLQYGPVYVCGGTAFSDVKTETDPAKGRQSVEVRLLRMG